MPQIKSAEKQARAAVGKRLRNKSVQSQAKTDITKAEKLIFSGELEAAQKAVVAAITSPAKAEAEEAAKSEEPAKEE